MNSLCALLSAIFGFPSGKRSLSVCGIVGIRTNTLYLFPETISEQAEAALQALESIYISDLTEVEFYSLAAKKLRMGVLSEAKVRHVMMKFDSLVEQDFFHRVTVLPDDLIRSKFYLSELKTNLQTLVALHVAVAERLEAVLVTSDKFQADGADYFCIPVTRVQLLEQA